MKTSISAIIILLCFLVEKSNGNKRKKLKIIVLTRNDDLEEKIKK